MMSVTCGPTSGTQFAYYDHDSHSWKMWPAIGLWGSIEYSETVPKTGYMSAGRLFELPTSVPAIIANASSSSSRVLPTPNASDPNETRTTHAGGNLTLQGAVGGVNPVDLQRHIAAGRIRRPAETQPTLLPTPRASDPATASSRSSEGYRPQLGETVRTLPTPTATTYGSNQSPSPGAAVRPSIDGIVRMLPTPTAFVHPAADSRDPVARAESTHQTELSDVVRMLPTPRAVDDKGSMTAPSARKHVADGFGSLPEVIGAHLFPWSLDVEAPEQLRLLPTPEAKLHRSGVDPSRGDRPGSGGPDLITAVDMISNPREVDDLSWGDYGSAIRRQEALSRPAPPPTEINSKGNPRLSPRFAEWMMWLPEGWVTDPAIGLSRNEQLKAIGNGVVPRQAVTAFRYLLSVKAVE